MVGKKIRFGSLSFDLFNYVFVALLIFVTLYPFYYVGIVSISNGMAVLQGQVTFWPVDINFVAYEMIFGDEDILIAYKNTLIYTVSGTFINLVLTAFCAYPLSKKRLVFKNFFMTMIIFTMFFQGGIIPRYLVIQSLGMIDTIWAIILPQAIITWFMIIMRTFFRSIPDSLEESAYMDGANDIQNFIRIYLPLSKAIIATLVVFYSVDQWNNFFPALIFLHSEEKFPLTIILRQLVVVGEMSDQVGDIGSADDFALTEKNIKYAVIIFATLPILAVYPFLQKYFVKGVMIGSIKG